MRSKKDGIKPIGRNKHSDKDENRKYHKKVRKAGKKTSRDLEEDAESFKDFKKKGKVELDAPKVKQRNAFAPPTKRHKSKKGKGSYDRKKLNNTVKEEKFNISLMIDCILEKNYSQAHKYLKKVIDSKIERKIKDELQKPLL